MEWDTPESSIYDSVRVEQGLPGLAAGASTSVVRQVPAGRPIRVQVSVDLYGDPVAEAEFQAPACALPATAPTMTAEVAACADENGGAIGVTVTNPPGGSESHFEVAVYKAAGFPPEGDASFSVLQEPGEPGDGEHAAVVVDELTFRSPTDEAGRVQPLAAGDYLVQLSWAVADYAAASPRTP